MFSRLFPRQVDNNYRGHWLGMVILVAVAVIKALQGVESMVNTHDTAINADGIPLDSYGGDAAGQVMIMFALLGMWLLVVPLQSLVVLIRWRALIPFMFLSLIAIQLGGRALHIAKEGWPDFTAQPIGFWINMGILAVTIIGFFLSLMDGRPAAQRSGLQ